MSNLEDTMMEIPAWFHLNRKDLFSLLTFIVLNPLRFQENMKMRGRLSRENSDSKVELSTTDIDGLKACKIAWGCCVITNL